MADRKRGGIRCCGCRVCRSRLDRKVREYHRSVNRVMAELDERSRRLLAGLLARQFGRGGLQRVLEITGLSRVTIRRGLRECQQGQAIGPGRVRGPGGGRQSVEKKRRVSTDC